MVGAGDMIGATPLLSGLFHDEPTIEFLNYTGVDTVGVGNHEFDEGKDELLRMQYGNQSHDGGGANTGTAYGPVRPDGCHPVDGCQDGTPFYGSVFQYLAANVIDQSTENPLLPAYDIVNTSTGEKIAFIGETLKGTPLIVTPSGVAGLDFLDEADTVNALVPRLKQRGAETIVLLLHQGGFQNPPPPSAGGFTNVDLCQNFSGPEVTDIVNRLDPEVDVVVSGHTHAPYICTINNRLVTSASSFGRVITEIKLTIDRRTNDVVSATADNHIVTQDVPKDAGATAIVNHYKTFADPIANQVVGSITREPHAQRDAGRRVRARRHHRGRAARGDDAERLRWLCRRVHEPGRDPLRPDLHPDRRGPAGRDLREPVHGAALREHRHREDVHGRPDRRSPRAAGLAEPVCEPPGGRSHPPGVGGLLVHLAGVGSERTEGRSGVDQDRRRHGRPRTRRTG